MGERPIIRNLLAYFLLVVFTISSIPKSFFHDLLANHQDVVSCEHPRKSETCIHPKGFNCSFEKLVVTSPYVVADAGFNLIEAACFISYTSLETKLVLPLKCYFTESRGPPSIV